MAELDKIILNGTTYDIGGSGGDTGSIPAENVKETEVSENVDILPYMDWTTGLWINGSTGVETENANYSTSDYYPVGENVVLTSCFSATNYKFSFHYYDSNKVWKGCLESGYSTANVPLTLTTPTGTAYIRFSVAKTYVTGGKWLYVNVPMTYTVRDWQDTLKNRMNQLAVRADIYDKLDSIFDVLLWNLTKWKGKTLVTDGNSLVESVNWGTHTAQLLGMNFVNLGASGSNLVHGQTTMAGIKNLVANDFPDEADLILLQGDSNTMTADSVNPADQMDGENATNTWAARINYLVRCLKAKYPNVVIALMPDSVRYDRKTTSGYAQNPPSPNIVYPNKNIYEGMKKIAEYNRHHFLDIDGDTPFNPTNYSNEYVNKTAASDFTENDGTHPGGYFAEAKGKAVAWWVAGLTYDPRADNHAVSGWQNLVTASISATYGSGITHTSNATDIQYYMYYDNTLTGASSVTVTMGGVDVTSSAYNASTGRIFISRVTGNIVITAS